MWEYIGYWPTLNDNRLDRFHFQLSRWDTKYKEFSHILSEYLPLDNVKLISRLLKDSTYQLNISSSPQFLSIRQTSNIDNFALPEHDLQSDAFMPSIFPFNCPWCPDTSLEHDILTVLFAETCFYGGGDCGESNTGHRQRGNQPHGTHIPVFQLTRQLYRR